MRIVALAGGVGGAKMAHGLAKNLPPEDLTIIVNTGDDFEHFGLHISPDIDTVCYTLADAANPVTGWGLRNETWHTLSGIRQLGGPGWFQLGDHDLSTHLERTRRLMSGQSLSEIVREFCIVWGIRQTVLPMTDSTVRTIVHSDQGELDFQRYFVELQCQPRVTGFEFRGAEDAVPAADALQRLEQADGIVICPSNPWVSIGPITAIPGVKAAIAKKKTVAVSPIIGGKAVRGPAAKMYSELGLQPSAATVARHYRDLISAFVLDEVDRRLKGEIKDSGMRTLVTNTLMTTIQDRQRLAAEVLDFLKAGLN